MLRLDSIVEFLLRAWILTFAVGLTKIGPFPIKALITLSFLFFSSILLLTSKALVVKHKPSLLSLAVWILAASAIGIVNGFASSTISQTTSLVISLLITIISFILCKNNKIKPDSIASTIYITATVGVLLKILIAAALALDFIGASEINAMLELYFGMASESIHNFGGFLGILPRIGNAGDLFFLIVFIFYSKKHKGLKPLQMWALMLAFVLISYSRYLMLVFLLASIYFTAGAIRKSPFKVIGVAAILTPVLLAFLDTAELIVEFNDRFTGQIQSESDAIRLNMMKVLFNTFFDNILFGIGMGGYVQGLIRSDQNLWMYELEYLAMLMQFGIFGFIFITVNYVAYVVRILFDGQEKELTIAVAMGIVFWLGTPIQSALFTGTQSSLILLSIFYLSRGTQSKAPAISIPTAYRAPAHRVKT